MHDNWYANLSLYMYLIPTSLYTAFVVLYATRTRSWRRTSVGRAVMTQAGSLAAVFGYISLMLAVDLPDEMTSTLRTLLIGGVTIASALMLKNLLVEQSNHRHPDRAP